ncbi:unnamed protein product, partial [Meganyctiphanes norvegica]
MAELTKDAVDSLSEKLMDIMMKHQKICDARLAKLQEYIERSAALTARHLYETPGSWMQEYIDKSNQSVTAMLSEIGSVMELLTDKLHKTEQFKNCIAGIFNEIMTPASPLIEENEVAILTAEKSTRVSTGELNALGEEINKCVSSMNEANQKFFPLLTSIEASLQQLIQTHHEKIANKVHEQCRSSTSTAVAIGEDIQGLLEQSSKIIICM